MSYGMDQSNQVISKCSFVPRFMRHLAGGIISAAILWRSEVVDGEASTK